LATYLLRGGAICEHLHVQVVPSGGYLLIHQRAG
jgi:hypothetical protein